MATNEVYRYADWISLPMTGLTGSGDGGAVVSGDPVVVGSLPGVCQVSTGEGGNATDHASIALCGAFNLPVTAAAAIAVGDPVYYAAAGTLSDTNTDTLFGYALEALGVGAGTIPVRIAQV